MSDDIVTVNLQGDKDIVAAFKDLREYLPKTALRQSVRQAAQYMAAIVISLAPRLTGRLALNIGVRTKATDSTIQGNVTVNTGGGRNSATHAFYWRFLEEGWHTKNGAFHQFPFIAPAFHAQEVQAAQTVIDSCGAAIDRAEAKARRSG